VEEALTAIEAAFSFSYEDAVEFQKPLTLAGYKALALLRPELDRLRGIEKAAGEVERMAFRQYLDWSHFHGLAMAEPFHAEVEAQDFARSVSSLLTPALARPDRQEEGE
jgi:hypothetical protein